jgi:hypothetical protein
MKQLICGALLFFALAAALSPAVARAQTDPSEGGLVRCGYDCDFDDAIEAIDRIMKYIIYMSVPIATLLFAYAGGLYFADRGSESQVKKAHGVFSATVWGIVIMLCAWLIVHTIIIALVEKPEDYSLLEG